MCDILVSTLGILIVWTKKRERVYTHMPDDFS
jgi:hypothetical protein